MFLLFGCFLCQRNGYTANKVWLFFWPLNSRLDLFWPLFCIVWLCIEIFIWQPWLCRVRFYIWILFSVCGGAIAFSNKPFRQWTQERI